MHRRRLVVFGAGVCLIGAVSPLALAGPAPRALAHVPMQVAKAKAPASQTPQQAFEQAKTLMKEGRYRDACRAFAASEQPAPTMSTRYHLGRCHEGLGEYQKAHGYYRDAARIAARKGDKPREKAAQVKATEMKRREKEARRAAAERRKDQQRQAAQARRSSEAVAAPAGPTKRRSSTLFFTGIGLTAAGGVALVAASLVSAGESCSSCAPPPGAIAGGVLGLAGIGAGVPLFLIFGKKVPVAQSAWVQPAAGPGYVQIRGRF